MKLITQNFKTHAAKQFVESFSESSNTIYYIGAHKSTPFSDDNNPPDPTTNVSDTHYTLYDELIFGKHVTPADIAHMIRNEQWESGTIYDMYDNTVESLETKNFYVISPESSSYHIFKCLNNNGGVPSTDQPLFSETAADDEIYLTTDGYQWKYMYSITNNQYSKFATSDYAPVFVNANVTGNAVSGSIETILIETAGSNYNSFAAGTVKESAVAGNNLIYSLNSDQYLDYDLTLDDATGFVEEKVTSLNSNGRYANGVILAVYANNTIRVTNVNRAFETGQTVTGTSSSSTATIASLKKLTTALSANTDFYKNNAFYIRSGRGAGQLRTITEYIVTGDERRVLLNTPLNPLPDSASEFEIGPRVIITGDGVNANAIATVSPTANSVAEIEIINSGSHYTYADITIIANTGLIDSTSNLVISTTSAVARAIISPPGGHGSDIVNELYANRVGIGMQIANTESSTIPATNDYRKITLIKDPLFANVELTLASSVASSFTAGEVVVQANTGATGTITNRDGDVLRLTNITGFFITGANVAGATSSYSANVTSIDKSFSTFDQREIYQVETLYAGPNDNGFELDELVIQVGIQQLSSNVVSLTLNQSSYLYNDAEVITQANTGATGVISNRINNTITLYNVSGEFTIGNSTVNYITGGTANVASTVQEVNNTFQANALGYIHSLNSAGANSTVIGLTGTKGFFSISDDASGTINTFVGQTNKAETKITGRVYDYNSLVDGSGEFLFVENFSPITRNSDQTEKIKLVIEF
jgi:hypothetical protein